MSGFLIFSSNSNGQRNTTDINYFDAPDNNDFIESVTDQTSNTGLFKFSANYKKDVNSQLDYDVIGRFSNEFRTDAVNSRVLSDISENERATPYTINQNLSYFPTLIYIHKEASP